jgi:predicted secreted Zn-dependent protease
MTVAVQPDFKIKWVEKKKASYTVPGKTYADVFKFFQKKNANKEEWGKFSHTKPGLAFKPAKGEPITDVVLKVGYTITMPKWPKVKSAPEGCQEAWNKMIKALEKHEDNHRLILLEECAKIAHTIGQETDLTRSKMAELFSNFAPDVKAAQDKYDAVTRNGENEGVFLPAPDECGG